jgi:hypothetical protein
LSNNYFKVFLVACNFTKSKFTKISIGMHKGISTEINSVFNLKTHTITIINTIFKMKKLLKSGFLMSLMLLSVMELNAQQWQMQKAALMTSYAAKVDTANVLGEYPRPQMARQQWMNLNGIWQFQPGTSITEAIPTGKLSSKILVPFPVESAISGIMTHYDKLWYRKVFTVPTSWAGQHVLIHFGAVDYQSEVFVNGQSVGTHQGGYDPFTFDITAKLTTSGPQTITVRVYDPTDAGGQPRGKQTLNPGGIMYTCTSGIWQSVWLEPVPTTSISDIKIIPNVDNSTLTFKALSSGPLSNLTVAVEVKDGANTITKFSGNANTDLVIPVPNAKLWSPDSPFLYDLKVTLKNGTNSIDSLSSYFGMRKISMAKVGDYQKMMLNNEFLFHMGPLDQGFWPDGNYTAPTDEAIQNDLLKMKQAGFNMIRKHIKVEPYRWYYWADKLGLMVWQDMPSPNSYTNTHPAVDEVAYKSELETMVKTHWNSPCIVMWVVFNEGQGQQNTPALVADVRSLDPNRLINQASGGGYEGVGDILDYHSYPPPACPSSATQILACGEYGGIGYSITDHIWKPGFGYVMVNSATELLNMYSSFADNLIQFKTNSGLSAAVYTETTDVEIELNGFMTYDRAVVKADINKFFEINQRIIKKDMYLTAVLPTSQVTAQTWKSTTTKPATDWYTSTFNDGAWTSAQGGFGTAGTPGAVIKTTWNTADIWLRKQFTVGALTPQAIDSLVFSIHHDEDCEIYINGILGTSLTGYSTSYIMQPLSTEGKNAIKLNSQNTIAIHCHQTAGGQYIDAGISVLSYSPKSTTTAVTKISDDSKISIFPNPAGNTIRVQSADNDFSLVGIYNILGSLQQKLNKSDKQIDVSSLKPGMYFLKIKTGQNQQNISFLKQ